jgi:hypothetical protein
MLTHVQVVTTSIKSLRNRIVNDPKLDEYFRIIKKQEPNRAPGWARLRSIHSTQQGTVQIEWNAKTKMLLCSIVNKAKGRPDDVVGELVRYLLCRFSNHIRLITIIPQKR